MKLITEKEGEIGNFSPITPKVLGVELDDRADAIDFAGRLGVYAAEWIKSYGDESTLGIITYNPRMAQEALTVQAQLLQTIAAVDELEAKYPEDEAKKTEGDESTNGDNYGNFWLFASDSHVETVLRGAAMVTAESLEATAKRPHDRFPRFDFFGSFTRGLGMDSGIAKIVERYGLDRGSFKGTGQDFDLIDEPIKPLSTLNTTESNALFPHNDPFHNDPFKDKYINLGKPDKPGKFDN